MGKDPLHLPVLRDNDKGPEPSCHITAFLQYSSEMGVYLKALSFDGHRRPALYADFNPILLSIEFRSCIPG